MEMETGTCIVAAFSGTCKIEVSFVQETRSNATTDKSKKRIISPP
jgi:hypothetical protein